LPPEPSPANPNLDSPPFTEIKPYPIIFGLVIKIEPPELEII